MAPTSSAVPFHCQFCRVHFGTSEKLKTHLIEVEHLIKARSSWGIETSKECCLVAFSNGKVKGRQWLLNWFSSFLNKNGTQAFKTILWWDERPRTIIIEYETREQADGAVATLGGLITDTYIRTADEMNTFEWLSLFPETIANRLSYSAGSRGLEENKNGSHQAENSNNGAVKRKLEQVVTPSSSTRHQEAVSSKVQKIKTDQGDNQPSPLEMLNKLAEKHGWLLPQFFISKVGNIENETYFLSVVLVDGVDWARETILCSTEEEAKQQIAMKALDAILDSLKKEESVKAKQVPPAPPTISQPVKNEPISLNGVAKETPKRPDQPNYDRRIKQEENDFTRDNFMAGAFMNDQNQGGFRKEEFKKEEDDSENDDNDGHSSEDDSDYNEEADTSLPPIPIGTCPVETLERMAFRNGWGSPQYFVSKFVSKADGGARFIRKKKQKGTRWKDRSFNFAARILLNRDEYQTPRQSQRHSTVEEAKRHIAWICLNQISETGVKKTNATGAGNILEGIEQLTGSFINSCADSSFVLPSCLQSDEYLAIRHSTLISDEWFQPILNIMGDLRNLVHYNEPSINTVMFRTWSLKLKNIQPLSGEDEQMVYLHRPDFSGSRTWVTTDMIQRIFRGGNSELEKAFSVVNFIPERGYNGTVAKWKIIHNPSGATFSLTSLKSHLLEVQTWRLLNYMCTFDIRCHHLIALAQYWATQNDVKFQDREQAVRGLDGLASYQHIMPESLTLPWLIVLFLINRGYLPSSREIQQRPHQILIDPVSGEDIGFSPDPTFVLTWKSPKAKKITRIIPGGCHKLKENFVYEVLVLFRDWQIYLERGSLLGGRNWLLNIRDGEWIDKKNFLGERPSSVNLTSCFSNMSLKEDAALRQLQGIDPHQDPKDGLDRVPWYVANPLVVTCRFPCSSGIMEILKLMCYTRIELTEYLGMQRKVFKGQNMEDGNHEEVGTLESYLVIDRDQRIQVMQDTKFPNRKNAKKKLRELKKVERLAKKNANFR